MRCDRCAGARFTKAGWDRARRQLYRCTGCGRRLTARTGSAFSGYRFPDEVIALAVRWYTRYRLSYADAAARLPRAVTALAVRWYLRYRLSYADVAEWLAERGVAVGPSTIYDWVQAFTPRFIAAARADRSPIGTRWRVDETYLKIGRRWRYLY